MERKVPQPYGIYVAGLGRSECRRVSLRRIWTGIVKDIKYRCGWCGTPTNKHGVAIHVDLFNGVPKDEAAWNAATSVHGDCCEDQEQLDAERDFQRRMAEFTGGFI